jgi:stearoyl-CoA desaturase (Delta-9 desaturase)
VKTQPQKGTKSTSTQEIFCAYCAFLWLNDFEVKPLRAFVSATSNSPLVQKPLHRPKTLIKGGSFCIAILTRLNPLAGFRSSGKQQRTRAWPHRLNWNRTSDLMTRIRALLGTPGFLLMHIACPSVIWTGTSRVSLIVCIALYLTRMIGITLGYHRYFSHRTYKTSRTFQLILALLGASAAQQGPLWWAGHHRHHHRFSDTSNDSHSPSLKGFWWSHVGWILAPENKQTKYKLVPDLLKFPELRFLNKYYFVPPLVLAVALFALGFVLGFYVPHWKTSGFQLLGWGFFVSTVLLYHGTFCVNSFTHIFGRRRFQTNDDSRNSWVVALITLGEGWHNNHHFYPASERQGLRWWEIDISHYVLRVLAWMRIVWDVQKPAEGQRYDRVLRARCS